ncbi:unnamed protein product, partial [Meganyctiphanes norvegica]
VPELSFKELDAFENILNTLKPFYCEVLNLKGKRNRKSSEKEFLEYHQILKTVLQNSPRVWALLDISKTSLYPIIQSHASQLEVLSFLELSNEDFFPVFFKNQSEECVIEKIRRKKDTVISFPKLKIIGLPFEFDSYSHKVFLQAFIHCYPQIHTLYYDDIKSVSVNLLMDDCYEIFRLNDRPPCKVKSIAFSDLLEVTNNSYGLMKICPLIRQVIIYAKETEFMWTKKDIDNVLNKFNIDCLTFRIQANYISHPLEFSLVSTLKVLHLELEERLTMQQNSHICELIDKCENLESLKIMLISLCDVGLLVEHFENHGDVTTISEKNRKIMRNLTTLSCYGSFGGTIVINYEFLLNWLIKYSPNLSCLEISRRDIPVIKQLAEFGKLDKLKHLTLIGEDYCVSGVTDLVQYPIKPLVNSLPSLQTLVLYTNSTTCAYLKRTYNKTALKVINGTSELFEETTYNLLVNMAQRRV